MHVLKSVELLSKLIAFDTTSYKSNLEFILFVKDLFEQNNIRSNLILILNKAKRIYWQV